MPLCCNQIFIREFNYSCNVRFVHNHNVVGVHTINLKMKPSTNAFVSTEKYSAASTLEL